MSRISRDQMFMQMAKVAALRSTCFRLNVGAVIVQNHNIISIGYNGVPSGHDHCSGNDCPGKLHCHETTHAETNALDRVPKGTFGLIDVYVTHSPCPACSKALAVSRKVSRTNDLRVRRVIFENPYRDPTGLAELAAVVDLQQLTPAGYLIDWLTKDVIETP